MNSFPLRKFVKHIFLQNQLLKITKELLLYFALLLWFVAPLRRDYHNFFTKPLKFNELIIKALQLIKSPLFRFDSVLAVFLLCSFCCQVEAQPNFFFTSSAETVEVNDEFQVSLRATNFVDVAGLQFSLNWDAEKVEFQDITPSFPTQNASFNTNNASNGVIAGFWNDSFTYSEPDSTVLLVLTFRALADGPLNLEFVDSPVTTLVIYHLDGQVFEVPILYNGDGGACVGVKTSTFATDFEDSPVFYQNNPNPFSKTTYIPFELTNSELVTIKIFALTGEEIYQYSNRYSEGTHRIEINSEVFPNPGTYLYQITTTATSTIKKMILAK